jgi:hypothetical protein
VSAWVSPVHVAGVLAVLVGVVDAWAFHAFGLTWDEALILAGVAWLGGVAVPSPIVKS